MTPIQRSIFFSAAERYASLILFFISTAVLARLLTPKEFGVYAVVGAVTTMVSVSSQEFGGANYLIQKTTLDEGHVRTAFTITLALSLAIGALLAVLGGALGAWFRVDGVGAGVRIAALGFLVSPFSTTLLALLRRDLKFGEIAASNLLGNVAMVVVSITLAAMGYSFFAPIWGQVAGSVVQTAYLVAAHRDFRIFRPSLSGQREVVHFGLYSSGVVLINVAYNSAPQLFLARVLGFTAVGLYSRAVAVTQVFDRLVIQAISPVIMPAVAAQNRAGDDLKRVYLHAVSLLTALQWPFFLFVAMLAEPIIAFWLGPSWLAAAPLVRLLSIAYLALFGACLTYPVLVAAGSVRDTLVSSLISLPPSLAAIFIASFFSVEAVAASALATLPFQAAVAIYFVGRRLHFGVGDLVGALRKSAFVALCAGAAVAIGASTAHYGHLAPIAAIALSAALAAPAWLAALAVADHPLLAELKSAARGLRAVLGRGAPPVAAGAGGPGHDIVETVCNARESN
ncbi:oligosaccharide flippase family protein [Rhodoblastus acidophilus]|uniref:Oligosaccharide flippase family protein n=1 Tax=Candidatus Rhodoblastus alkanivorans TaxID=2954117 RepID=A0ABS9ZAN3_9HYPH|nr:oligosaccharide flippase family protein [Candidatus Rhodoblastus alkanivorans]MCI4677052.1 oligosaccharide flippase family protein [Candidatus Rhodoblastus alkanivorans]MCI4684405.1 oligosaccharide flippase family protein [Candidatus Rhodoblastus alkanivorans]MDI4641726.1 oligosaccharide flippase family protein [Rhodoblastus acidophilus]